MLPSQSVSRIIPAESLHSNLRRHQRRPNRPLSRQSFSLVMDSPGSPLSEHSSEEFEHELEPTPPPRGHSADPYRDHSTHSPPDTTLRPSNALVSQRAQHGTTYRHRRATQKSAPTPTIAFQALHTTAEAKAVTMTMTELRAAASRSQCANGMAVLPVI